MINGRFAFQSWDVGNGNIHIYTVDANGLNLKKLTDSPRLNFSPSVSPDGRKIIFVSGRSNSGSDEIYTMNFDGSEQTRLTFSSSGCYNPSFSPDGDRIVFTSSEDKGHAVHVMNADGTNQVRITDGHVPYRPVFTADGQSVIYNDGTGILYIVGADGSNHRTLFDQKNKSYEDVAVNPNGSAIVFEESTCHYSEDDYEYTYSIFTSGLDGSNLTELTDGFANAFSPAFSPDGSKLAFFGKKDENTKGTIYVSFLDGSEPKLISDGPIKGGFLSWAPIPS